MNATSDSKYSFLTLWLLVIVSGLAIMIVYSPALTDQPLLDEQFILKWISSIAAKHSSKWSEFFAWQGPDPHDAWGMLVPVNLFISGGISDVAKFLGLFGHWLNTALLFLVTRRVTIQHDEKGAFPLVAIFAALLFAVYPLAPEAVSYLGGRASVMGVTFVLLSFWVYLYGRQLKTKEELRVICMIASVAAYVLAICCDLGFWSAIFAFIGFEYAERIAPLEREPRTLKQTMIMMGAHCVVAFFAQVSYITSNHFGPLPQFSDFPRVLYRMLCPVSNINSDAGILSGVLLTIYAIPLVLLIISLKTSPRQRRLTVLAIYWVLGALASNAALAAVSDNLYGARWLYFAAIPMCMLLGAGAGAATTIVSGLKPVTTGVAIAICAIVCGVYVKLTWTQNQAYCQSGATLKRIQKALKTAVAPANKPFAIVSNVPPESCVVPLLSKDRFICMDTETGLVRAFNVNPGHLHESWRHGKHLRESVTWTNDTIKQMPEAAKAKKELKELNDSQESQDPQEHRESKEPKTSKGLKISRDSKDSKNSKQSKDLKETKESTSSSTPDTVAATDTADKSNKSKEENTADLPLEVKLNRLKEDIPPGALGRMPLMSIYVSNRSPAPRNEFKDLCFDFPNAPELGLLRMFGRHNTLRLVYDVTAVAGAKKVLIEVSHPNRFLGNPNSTALSPYRYRTIAGSIPKSEKVLRAQFFPGKGVYEVRMIACDKRKKLIGRFADSVMVHLTY